MPKYFKIDLGIDRWNTGFNGYLKDWNFAVGEGAYRETDLRKLYENNNYNSKFYKEKAIIESSEKIVEEKEFLGYESIISTEIKDPVS